MIQKRNQLISRKIQSSRHISPEQYVRARPEYLSTIRKLARKLGILLERPSGDGEHLYETHHEEIWDDEDRQWNEKWD